MPEENLPLPIEIPWKLVSTTQPLATGEPDQTSISMFVFEPDDDKLTGRFPKERLIYLKFTVSVSPASIPDAPQVAALGEGIPCFHLKLDLKISKASREPGTIRPYFHSAAPLHRTMVQSGVIGLDLFEGEADAQFMGKSGSQMYESASSRSRTTTAGAGASFGIPILGGFSIGGSVRSTSTDVSAQRAVSQVVDTTQRQASEERRQLISHSTKVENVLTLLNGKFVGTPHLSFSLYPQPLQLLSVDPSDPNIWYSQLLQRISSGIEGIQEFTAVILVPKGKDFCVRAKLQRVCVLDNPPGPLSFRERYFHGNPDHRIRLIEYLNRIYPQGTPLEELDLDIGPIPWGGELPRPVLDFWINNGRTVIAVVRSPTPNTSHTDIGGSNRGWGNYKDTYEIWFETLRDEYEHDVVRTPLERGILLGEQRILDTCLSFDDDGRVIVSDSSMSVSPLFPIPFDPADIDVGGVSAITNTRRSSAREQAFETITRWNLLESRMAIVLANQKDIPDNPPDLRYDDEHMVSLLIDRWAKLNPASQHNLSFEQVMKIMHLNENHRRLLKSAGATDLRSIAWVIKAASGADRYDIDPIELEKEFKSSQNTGKVKIDIHKIREIAVKPNQSPISPKDGVEIRRAIGKALQDSISVKATKK